MDAMCKLEGYKVEFKPASPVTTGGHDGSLSQPSNEYLFFLKVLCKKTNTWL